MIRKRTSKTLLAAAIALQASLAQALGLGDITLRSALDEPLSAEIRLRGIGDLSADQILVNMASGMDFERAGVERLYALAEIRFEVELLANGDGRIQLSTERPVREPYLDFVVEVRWPNGRVLREYTVLLDLPTTTPAPPPVVRAPARAGRSEATAPGVVAGGGAWSGGDNYGVQSGDTLWSIASRTRPSGVSVQQMMVALQRENPEAFIRGNMNLLRAGAILRIPAAAAVSQAEALGEIEAQARDWRSGGEPLPAEPAGSTPGTAGGDAEAAPAGAAPAERAYLELAAGATGGTGSATGGVEGGAGNAPLQEQLAAAQENLSATERENAELQSRVAALEEQVQTYERLVELKSEGGAAAQQAAGEAAGAATEPAAAPQPEAAAAAPPATVVAGQERGLLARLMDNTMMLGTAIAVLFAAALAFVFLRRRREDTGYAAVPESSHEQRAAARTAAAAAEEPRGFRMAAPVVSEVEDDQDVLAQASPRVMAAATAAAAAPAIAAAAPAAAAPAAPEHRDPVSEADILIAYGRLERAEEILVAALQEDRGRSDVRLKLMEMQADRGDERAFLAGFDHFASTGDAASMDAARTILSARGMADWLHAVEESPGVQSAADEQGFRAPSPGAPASGADADEIALASMEVEGDLSHLDAEIDLDLEAELAQSAESEQGNDADLELELGELDFGGGLDETAAPAEEIAAEFDLDLGAPEEPGGTGLGQEPAVAAEFDLELGDLAAEVEADAGAAAVAAGPASAEAALAGPAQAEDDADLGLLEGSDEIETKLELARAYIDMGDTDGARDILDEVVAEGTPAQREQATALLERLRTA